MKPTVLIADNDAQLCGTTQQFLRERGYEAEIACDGLECVAKLRRLTPAAVVLDLDLLWGGGDGVLAWLREERDPTGVPVVLTATARSAQPLEAFSEPPVVGHLLKPFALTTLLAGVRAASSPLGRAETKIREVAGEPEAEPLPPRIDVLVVDDEHLVRLMVQLGLEQKGFNVWMAPNGRDAIERYREEGEDIDVVLLDVCMPGLDGPQTLEALRALNPDVPACFMSGNPGVYTEAMLLQRGAACVIAKPFHLDQLADVLRRLARAGSAALMPSGEG